MTNVILRSIGGLSAAYAPQDDGEFCFMRSLINQKGPRASAEPLMPDI